jgi:N4-(beta-N-acetylglucosaminyl)-L-asparaginase
VTVESRLKGDDGRPNFSVNYYAVNKNGEYGGAAIWSGARYAVSVDGASRHEDSAYLFERA